MCGVGTEEYDRHFKTNTTGKFPEYDKKKKKETAENLKRSSELAPA